MLPASAVAGAEPMLLATGSYSKNSVGVWNKPWLAANSTLPLGITTEEASAIVQAVVPVPQVEGRSGPSAQVFVAVLYSAVLVTPNEVPPKAIILPLYIIWFGPIS